MAENKILVTDNAAASRYEATVDGTVALLLYRLEGDRIVLLHTEVPGVLEGRGVGSALARTALEDARARKLAVVPQCPFVSAYIGRHPEHGDIVAIGHEPRS